jgi:hypothetical protein
VASCCSCTRSTDGGTTRERRSRSRRALNERRIATVDVNLLTTAEQEADAGAGAGFDATALGARVIALADELAARPRTGELPAALYGGGSGAAGALIAAAARPSWVRAVFSRAGRPDLAGEFGPARALPDAARGRRDRWRVARAERAGAAAVPAYRPLAQVPGASVLREEPEAMALVAELARDWFVLRLGRIPAGVGPTLSRSTGPPTLCRVSSSTPDFTRTCPWCADATVIGLSEEGMIRALTATSSSVPASRRRSCASALTLCRSQPRRVDRGSPPNGPRHPSAT